MPRPSLRDDHEKRAQRRASAMPVLTETPAAPNTPPAVQSMSANTATPRTTAAPATSDTSAEGAAPSQKAQPKRVRAPRPLGEGLVRRGYYLADEVWNDAKSAFLVDWKDGGPADSMAAWVGAAMRGFASLTVAERRAAIPLDNTATRPSGNHSLSLPANDVAAMEDAHTDDVAADLFCSLSEWVTAALTLATNTTRDRNGGTLPPAPARLPKRLVR